MFLLQKNLRIEIVKEVKVFLMLKKHINIKNLNKINIHMFIEFPNPIPDSVYIKLEK
jgi:hypothetical protein